MKKILTFVCLLTLGLSVFSQNESGQDKPKSIDSGVDYLILEMRLGAILGGFEAGKFVNAKTASKDFKVGQDYKLFELNGGQNQRVLRTKSMSTDMDDICPEYVSIETVEKAESGVALSSNAKWNATPRIPKVINSNNRVYRGIVRKFIQTKGIKRPNVKIQKILRVDLEGDGQNEVIIQASNRTGGPGFETKAGEYSFIMLRKIVDGRVKNIVLMEDFVTKNSPSDIPYNFELSAILDLDADGKMEIVTYGAYYEGAWVEAYQIKQGKANKILETGCGV